MKRRHAPATATGFLKVFCSSTEYDSVTGDLLEQYQRGRGRLWYWRQVLAIVFEALCDKVIRRPLLRTDKSLLRKGFVVGIVIAALFAVALSDVWPILIVGVVGGVIAGILKFGHDILFDTDRYRDTRNFPVGNPTKPLAIQHRSEPALAFQEIRRDEEEQIPMHVHRGINSTSIAGEGLEGLPGLLMVIAFVFIFLGLFMPRNNWFGGLFFIVEIGAAALYILLGRRNRKDSVGLQKTLHQINEPKDRINGSPTHVK